MKASDIILVVIAALLIFIAAELLMFMGSVNTNAKLIASSNQELAVSNNKLEATMAGVGENLEIVVNKFCGGRKKK